MRLASVEAIPYALPFRRPYVTARGSLDRREMVLLRLRDEEGVVGLGEAVPLSLRGGPSLAQITRELEILGDGAALSAFIETELEDSTLDLEWERNEHWGGILSPPSRCAVMTALLDLTERSDAIPRGSGGVAIATGRHDPGPVPCNATLVAGEPAAVAEEALRWAADGYRTFKLKLGTGDDVAQVKAVREALGPDPIIRVDANGAWSLETAARILAELDPLDIELVEQPVKTTEDAARLARRTTIPLAGDESIVTREDAEWALEIRAFKETGVKLSKVGGIGPGMEIASVMPAYVASALDGPVGIAAGCRLAQRFHYESLRPDHPLMAHGLATQRLFASTVAAVECELRDGMLHSPPGPGLGIEIDERALDHHRLDIR